MFNFSPSDKYKQDRPTVQMTSMMDIMFINLMFFMALFVYFQFENELGVKVPHATEAKKVARSNEIIVNIYADGQVMINRRPFNELALEGLFKKSLSIYPDQEVVIRADKNTRHQDVIKVLNLCAKTGVWNISFSALSDK